MGALENEGDKTFPALRKLLGLAKDSRFNFERGGEKRVAGKPRDGGACGRDSAPDGMNFLQIESGRLSANGQNRRMRPSWRPGRFHRGCLMRSPPAKWAGQTPEDGYCSFSVAAIRRLLPEMEKGIEYTDQRPAPSSPSVMFLQQVHELIPIVHDAVDLPCAIPQLSAH